MMNMADRIIHQLQSLPPGVPVTIESLAERLHCSPAEVLDIGKKLQNRAPGDDGLVTVIERFSGDDGGLYLSYLPLTFNDEPESR